MYEQLSIFDLVEGKPKPYQYDWIREIGMPVRYMIDGRVRTGIIRSFDNYYTFVEGERSMLALSCLNCWPFDDIEAMELEDIAEKVGNALGIRFTKRPQTSKYYECTEAYEAKVKGYKLEICKDTYQTMDDLDGKAFIGVEYDIKGGGGGAPCDSVNDAIMYFQKLLKGDHK